MKDTLIGIMALLELVGFIALVGIAGSVEQNTLTIADSAKYLIGIIVIMGVCALGLWKTRDRGRFDF